MFDANDTPEMGSPIERGEARKDTVHRLALPSSPSPPTSDCLNKESNPSSFNRQSLTESLQALKALNSLRTKRPERVIVERAVEQTSREPSRMSARTSKKRGFAAKDELKSVFETRITHDDFSPVQEPELELTKFLSTVDWEERLRGIAIAHRLVLHHQSILDSRFRQFVIVVASSVDSLRSSVCRAALQLVRSMAVNLGDRLSVELGCLVPSLLKKSSEMTFLSAEADDAMYQLIRVINPHAVIRTLSHFSSDRRVQSRVAAALAFLLESRDDVDIFRGRLGQAACESCLVIIEECIRDGNVDTRNYAKRCLTRVYETTSFEEWTKALRRHPDLEPIVRRLY
jgi:hypothetical protein